MGFRALLQDLGYPDDLPDASPPERPDVLVPVAKVGGAIAAEPLSHLLWEQLRQHAEPQVLEAMGEGLWELLTNVFEHSGAEAVAMGQVYQRGTPPHHENRVQVVIGDAGKGIRSSFLESGRFEPLDDAAAIELALEYLVTSVDDPGRGQGLFTTMEQMIELHGELVIRSGASKITVGRETRRREVIPHQAGTLVCMALPL